ncbi:tumor necrosis factor receptor superfamily member 13C [Carettochelys insculpta]|uniref:tumor necrosis factor receptor superfamily member 13C n=1 Tax=Carettochelys insculpta TaxID=44489 RepID=UPI003EBA5D43
MQQGSSDPSSVCFKPLCFDILTRGCVSCTELSGNSEEETTYHTTNVASTSSQAPATSPALLFGIPALVGLVLILAALWGLLTCRMRRQRQRKKRSSDEKPKENLDSVVSCESQVCKGPQLPEEDDLVLATCPHLNGALKHAVPAGRGDFSKRKPVCQGVAGNDVTELTGNEECDHSFPLPATELGATVLVTTKTIQNNCVTEERP